MAEEAVKPDYDLAFREVVEIEGGYSNHPYDSGGKTMYGITERVARQWGYHGPMNRLTVQLAREIYRERYWLILNLNVLGEHRVAAYIFDMSVNHGPMGAAGGATRIVQRAVNLLYRDERVDVDGFWGPQTLSAVEAASWIYPLPLLAAMKYERVQVYDRIVRSRPTQAVFWRGWLKRCA